MSSSSSPFITLAIEGRASLGQIDDFIDRWHEERCERQLHDYLGLTASEYALWLVEPDMLQAIVKARTNGIPLSAVVSDMLRDRGNDFETAGDPRLQRLGRWLAEQHARA